MRPERAEAPSPGQRPGFLWSRPVALKGQKLSINRQYTKLLPLQGALLIAMMPRALPWARRGCPFRAQGDLQPLFEPVLHAGSQQGFEILNGLLNLRFLSLDLLYALGKETLEREGWEDDREVFNMIFV